MFHHFCCLVSVKEERARTNLFSFRSYLSFANATFSWTGKSSPILAERSLYPMDTQVQERVLLNYKLLAAQSMGFIHALVQYKYFSKMG